jgi:ankyrin repeat protein
VIILDAANDLINQPDESGATPISYTVLNGHRKIVRFLINLRGPRPYRCQSPPDL